MTERKSPSTPLKSGKTPSRPIAYAGAPKLRKLDPATQERQVIRRSNEAIWQKARRINLELSQTLSFLDEPELKDFAGLSETRGRAVHTFLRAAYLVTEDQTYRDAFLKLEAHGLDEGRPLLRMSELRKSRNEKVYLTLIKLYSERERSDREVAKALKIQRRNRSETEIIEGIAAQAGFEAPSLESATNTLRQLWMAEKKRSVV